MSLKSDKSFGAIYHESSEQSRTKEKITKYRFVVFVVKNLKKNGSWNTLKKLTLDFL